MDSTSYSEVYTYQPKPIAPWDQPVATKSFFMVEVSSPIYGAGDLADVCVDEERDSLPVFVRSGKTASECVGISKTHGDSIVSISKIDRNQYLAEVRARFPVCPAVVSGGEF